MFNSLPRFSECLAWLGAGVFLVAFAAEAAAQEPSHLLAFSAAAVHAPDEQRATDLHMINSLTMKRPATHFRAVARPQGWTFYGRVGPMNFVNSLEPGSDGVQFTLRRNSHGLSGNIYLGIHGRF